MKPKWQKLASLAQKICTLWFQFFGAVFASKDNLFKNILYHYFSLEMVAILLNDLMLLLRNRYNKYWQTMCLSWPKILISAQNN